MNKIKIKDIYAGKPDAKDEISFDGQEGFIKTYVVCTNIDIESLTHGNKCFITGFKGVGKTALLFYLEDKLSCEDESTIVSYLFFKEDIAEIKRGEIQEISRRIISSIAIDPEAMTTVKEFEYIWRWILLKRIISDNEKYGRNLFVDNDEWRAFEKIMKRIVEPENASKMRVKNTIKLAVPVKDPHYGLEVSPQLEINLKKPDSDGYRKFVEIIGQAEDALLYTQRSDIPYYIFIDELEAYYGDEDIFLRDLGLIRDLLFSVKWLNSIFQKNTFEKTKVICSVRSEILNAISRFLVTKELNKITSGFSVPLHWNYTNSNSYAHPIIQIILKRIAVCEGEENDNMRKIYNVWFPEKIHGIEPASYILNNSWCKPRDIVRLIICAQNSLHKNKNSFSQAVFESLAKEYSEESLMEIKEELRALYSTDQIETIISCFTGYRTVFSFEDIQNRASQYFSGTILSTNLVDVLNDLYRLGFLGNYLPETKQYHWQHKGDNRLILTDEWRMFIHFALHGALSITRRNDRAIGRTQKSNIDENVYATIIKVYPNFALAHFEKDGTLREGYINSREFKALGYTYIDNLSSIVHEGERYLVKIMGYRAYFSNWELAIITSS